MLQTSCDWLRGGFCSTIGARSISQEENAAQGTHFQSPNFFLPPQKASHRHLDAAPPRYNRPISNRFASRTHTNSKPNSTIPIAAAPPRARRAMAARKFFVGGNWKCVSSRLSI